MSLLSNLPTCRFFLCLELGSLATKSSHQAAAGAYLTGTPAYLGFTELHRLPGLPRFYIIVPVLGLVGGGMLGDSS